MAPVVVHRWFRGRARPGRSTRAWGGHLTLIAVAPAGTGSNAWGGQDEAFAQDVPDLGRSSWARSSRDAEPLDPKAKGRPGIFLLHAAGPAARPCRPRGEALGRPRFAARHLRLARR